MRPSFTLVALAILPFAVAAPTPAAAVPPPSKLRLPEPILPRQDNSTTNNTDFCDLPNKKQPANSMTPPPADLTLVMIAAGEGTQNFSCESPTATPTSYGAMANLYNASCSPPGDNIIGKHYFTSDLVPDFDIPSLGNTQLAKVEDADAPNPDQDAKWLRLEAVAGPGTTSNVKMVYRLNTANGLAPTSCEGAGEDGGIVTTAYTAEYWIYAQNSAEAGEEDREEDGYLVGGY